jgi:hypothetical protein
LNTIGKIGDSFPIDIQKPAIYCNRAKENQKEEQKSEYIDDSL